MHERFARLPSALQRQARRAAIDGSIPALLAHPDWESPTPVVLWFHGRTVHKELDPGRYLRWLRSGIATCAIDLPGHGERKIEGYDSIDRTLYVVEQAIEEVDTILAYLGTQGVFDLERAAIGGMSAGGMVTLRRCCDAHPFVCASVESTSGDFSFMDYGERYERGLIDSLDPSLHVEGWRQMPLLALHSEADEWVAVDGVRSFMDRVRERSGDFADEVVLRTWPETGAPFEHAGFGRVANDAKNIQLDFFRRHLLGVAAANEAES
ncbi:MAG: alpha/beta hydrolase family protein [Phycisphaerales bacterium JB043]